MGSDLDERPRRRAIGEAEGRSRAAATGAETRENARGPAGTAVRDASNEKCITFRIYRNTARRHRQTTIHYSLNRQHDMCDVTADKLPVGGRKAAPPKPPARSADHREHLRHRDAGRVATREGLGSHFTIEQSE